MIVIIFESHIGHETSRHETRDGFDPVVPCPAVPRQRNDEVEN